MCVKQIAQQTDIDRHSPTLNQQSQFNSPKTRPDTDAGLTLRSVPLTVIPCVLLCVVRD